MHKAPDGISRNPEGRDRLILARAGELQELRARIKGIRQSIEKGDFDDDEPEVVEIAKVPAQHLVPIPGASSRVKDETTEKIKEAVEAKKARARKKDEEEMAKQRKTFLQGATAKGIDKQLSETIFDLMETFAEYGFNKSHSAAYALVSYQTAWLKTHHPAEFMAAVMSSDIDNTDKMLTFRDEARRMGLQVLPPSIQPVSYTHLRAHET